MEGGSWQSWIYVAACVVVPAAWGAVSAMIFAALDRRRAARTPAAGGRREPPIDYVI